MKFAKKRLSLLGRKEVVLGFFLILIAVVLTGKIFLVKDCKESTGCFDIMVSRCYPAKMIKINEDNMYRYEIKGRSGNDCVVEVKNVQMAVGVSVDVKEKFEGKAMECRIPVSLLKEIKFSEVDELTGYCSGPLKEAIYELLIERMYGLIISNLGEVVSEMEEFQGMP